MRWSRKAGSTYNEEVGREGEELPVVATGILALSKVVVLNFKPGGVPVSKSKPVRIQCKLKQQWKFS